MKIPTFKLSFEYFIFCFFWVIVLLPKALQLIVFLGLLLLVLRGKIGSSYSIFVKLQIVVVVMYMISLFFNMLFGDHEADRIFASINTLLITVVAVFLFQKYSEIKINEDKLGLFSLINILIMAVFWGLYTFVNEYISIDINGYSIMTLDWINGVQDTRFIGMLSYANMVTFFSLLFFPFAIKYLKTRKLLQMMLWILWFALVMSAHSRLGQVLVLLVVAISVAFYFVSKVRKKDKRLAWFIIVLLGVVVVGVLAIKLGVVSKLLYQRIESNSMRFHIYRESLQRMIDTHPLIGMGIKDILPNSIYPYGSHSTYVGYYYKVGIVGGTIYLISVICLATSVLREKASDVYEYIQKVSFLCIFIFMILEDVDGTNWAICLFYSVVAIFLSNKKDCKAKNVL